MNPSQDLCNRAPATQKAAIDGIADAIGIDDRTFKCVWPTKFGEVVTHGRVVIKITNDQPIAQIKRWMCREKIGTADQIATEIDSPVLAV